MRNPVHERVLGLVSLSSMFSLHLPQRPSAVCDVAAASTPSMACASDVWGSDGREAHNFARSRFEVFTRGSFGRLSLSALAPPPPRADPVRCVF